MIILMLTSALTIAATTSTSTNNKTNDKKNNEELRQALLNLNADIAALNNLGENQNADIVDELSNNTVNNGLNNLKGANQ